MGEVVQFPKLDAAEGELDQLLARVEGAGLLMCLLQNDGGDLCLAFEPRASEVPADGWAAAIAMRDRFADGPAFREAVINWCWSVGSTYVTGHLRSRKLN